MEPEITVAPAGRTARPRPSLPVRIMEMVGLALLGYGLAAGRPWLALSGAVAIIVSYALYRRRHGAVLPGNGPDGVGGD